MDGYHGCPNRAVDSEGRLQVVEARAGDDLEPGRGGGDGLRFVGASPGAAADYEL
ncbi:MAG: hypothetical protein ABWZ15_16830 [Acidimicrobiia bacterium]